MEIVIASLASSTDRRARIRRMMEGSDRRWRFHDALTTPPSGIPYVEAEALVRKGRPLSPGELAAFSTHRAILEQFVRDGDADHLLVLEDDILIDPGFPFERLPELMSLAGIGMLRLYARSLIGTCRRIACVGERHSLVRFTRPAFGTQAYLVTREGARRLLSTPRRIVRPCDDEFDRYWENGVPLYALYPFPVIELHGPTTIAGRDLPFPPLSPSQALRLRLHGSFTRCRRKAADFGLLLRDRRIRDRLLGAYRL
jgi:glycosyl transferase family 25